MEQTVILGQVLYYKYCQTASTLYLLSQNRYSVEMLITVTELEKLPMRITDQPVSG
ncbi:hypothetical protein [uncultured Clostridium sp.]|uniref:hypothetical protein n=1 Tax=uncultured Clostridium sp. TaxID=59620 RepID=UPI002671E5C3|nr:hypothetical protein [uncultured Clostridium sp.]